MMKFIFGIQINIKVFYKLILSFWVCLGKHAKFIGNKESTSLQYLQKDVGDEVGFLLVDKRESFLQVDTICLGVHSQACSKNPK